MRHGMSDALTTVPVITDRIGHEIADLAHRARYGCMTNMPRIKAKNEPVPTFLTTGLDKKAPIDITKTGSVGPSTVPCADRAGLRLGAPISRYDLRSATTRHAVHHEVMAVCAAAPRRP